MAEHGAEHLLKRVKENTPVDASASHLGRAPGTARASWRTKRISVARTASAEVYETGVESWDHITRFLEYGTGKFGPHHRPFVIRPKVPGGSLLFYFQGKWVFRKAIVNPGQRAQRPLATAAAQTEVELAAVLQADLDAWKLAVEARARAQF
jgi:hypothetical protein